MKKHTSLKNLVLSAMFLAIGLVLPFFIGQIPAIGKMLLQAGVGSLTMCDRMGILCEGQPEGLTQAQIDMAAITNRERLTGTLADALRGADAFVGVSAPNLVTADMVRTMADAPIVFACANPSPEILPEEAKRGGAAVVATGRSDYPNQINNVLVFPGVFRGALDVRASDINEPMKLAAAYALSELITDEALNAENIIPAAFDPRVGKAVAAAVAAAARESGVARL